MMIEEVEIETETVRFKVLLKIQELPDRYRMVLILMYRWFSHKRIAEKCWITVGYIQINCIARILKDK
jgi:DNA-directed RNA polymerase specialized sigma subunit